MRDVELPDERDDNDLIVVEDAPEPGQPIDEQQRVVSQAEVDEADGTAESDGRDAEPDSPARI